VSGDDVVGEGEGEGEGEGDDVERARRAGGTDAVAQDARPTRVVSIERRRIGDLASHIHATARRANARRRDEARTVGARLAQCARRVRRARARMADARARVTHAAPAFVCGEGRPRRLQPPPPPPLLGATHAPLPVSQTMPTPQSTVAVHDCRQTP
jgi:hypothetical protein